MLVYKSGTSPIDNSRRLDGIFFFSGEITIESINRVDRIHAPGTAHADPLLAVTPRAFTFPFYRNQPRTG